MSGLLEPITDILTRLSSVQVLNQSGMEVPLHARIWNEQISKLSEGQLEFNPFPAAYVEVVPFDATEIGKGVNSSDIIIRIHLAHENYDNGDGTFQQDLIIFGLRDKLIGSLQHFKPTGCSWLTKVHEEPNYDHAQVYEYIIDFATTVLDDAGSEYREGAGVYIDSTPPIALEIEAEILNSGNHQLTQQRFKINGT